MRCEKCNSNEKLQSHLKELAKNILYDQLNKKTTRMTSSTTWNLWCKMFRRILGLFCMGDWREETSNYTSFETLREQVRVGCLQKHNIASARVSLVTHLKLSVCVSSQNGKKFVLSPIQPTHWLVLNLLFLLQTPDGPFQTSCALSGCFWTSCSQRRPSCTCAPSPSTAT